MHADCLDFMNELAGCNALWCVGSSLCLTATQSKPKQKTDRLSGRQVVSGNSVDADLHPQYCRTLRVDELCLVSPGDSERRPNASGFRTHMQHRFGKTSFLVFSKTSWAGRMNCFISTKTARSAILSDRAAGREASSSLNAVV